MILYLDSSAIVKRYVVEPGSGEVERAALAADAVGTTIVSRAEVAAALHKAVRMRFLEKADGEAAIRSLDRTWKDLVRTRVTERLVKHAADLAGIHGLRGYDSLQLASAAAWQQALGRPVTMATFDASLWRAARTIGFAVLPTDLEEWMKKRSK